MKTKKDYEDLWQKARFNQEIIYKNISGKPIEEEKKSYAREICLTIHHRITENEADANKADAGKADQSKKEKAKEK